MAIVQTFDPFTSDPTDDKPDVFDPFTFDTSGIETPAWKKDRDAVLSSVLSGRTIQEVRPLVDTGVTTQLDSESASMSQVKTGSLVSSSLAESQELQETPLEAIDKLEGFFKDPEAPILSEFYDEKIFDTLRTSDNPLAREMAAGKLRRTFISVDMIRKKLGESQDESFITSMDWLDRMTVGNLPVLSSFHTEDRIDLARKFGRLLIGDLTDDVFIEETQKILDEAAGQGWFTDDNIFFLNELLEILPEFGFGGNINQQRAWAGLDIATLGVTPAAALKGLKTGAAVGASGTMVAADTIRGAFRLGFGAAGDAGRLIGLARKDPKLVEQMIEDAVIVGEKQTDALNISRYTNDSATTPNATYGEFLSLKAPIRDAERRSGVLARVAELDIPVPFEETAFKAFRDETLAIVKQQAADTGSGRYIDFNVVPDKFGSIFAQEIMGTTAGATFKGANGLRSAERLAADVGGEVRPALGEVNEWVVLKSENVATLPRDARSVEDIALWRATNPEELGTGFFANWGSALAQTTPALNGLLKQVESVHSKIAQTLKAERDGIQKILKKGEKKQVEDVFNDILNGEMTQLAYAPGRADFETAFFRVNGTNPTKGQKALYLKYQEISDVEYLVSSNRQFQQAVNRGEIIAIRDGGDGIRAIRSTLENHTPADGMILDIDKNAYVQANTLPDNTVVYRSAEGPIVGPDDTKASVFIMEKDATRRVYASDLLEYNPGGRRVYVDGEINFYIKQDKKSVMHDGSELSANPVTFMGVRLEAEAADTVKSINEIIDAIKVRFKGVTGKNINEALLAVPGDKALLETIGRNNKWNVNVNTIEEFVNFAKDSGINLTKKVSFVGDGQPIIEAGNLFPGVNASDTAGDVYRINSARSGARRDNVLIGYGGTANRTKPILESIEKGFLSTLTGQAEAAYVAKSSAGLLKAGAEHGLIKNLDELANLSIAQRIDRMQLDTTKEFGRRLELERQKLGFRMQKGSPSSKKWKATMTGLSDHLYGKGWKWGADKVSILSKDPVSAMRGFIFDSQLGFFAYDQLVVQGSQITSVAAIAGTQGIKGVASYPLTRFVLKNGNDAVAKRVGQILEPILGITADQYVEMVSMFKSSGRSIIDMGTTVEGGSGTVKLTRGLREKGRVFFNEGELMPRIAAHNAAYMEFIQKFPKAKPNTQEGRQWIINRQDVLTQGMTHASRTKYDWIPGAQFMSYTMRMAEAMLAGTFSSTKSVLTTPEKVRLAATHTFMYGAFAIPGANFILDKIEHNYGVRPEGDVLEAIRQGGLDFTISHLSGVDTQLSKRIAWGEGFFQLAYDTPEKGWLELIGGPTTDVVTNSISSAVDLARHMKVGTPAMLEQDMRRFAKSFKTGKLTLDGYMAFTTGEFLNRKNALVSQDNNFMESWLIMWGVPLEKHNAAYAALNNQFADKKTVIDLAKGIERQMNVYTHLLRQGELAEAKIYMEQIGLLMNALPQSQQAAVWAKVFPSVVPTVERAALEADNNAIRRGIE